MAFTAKDVAKLREQTGAGMMDCKKALTATDGDMAKAAEFLREQGVNIAAKKASRVASEGAVAAFVSADGKVGALAEVNCESDFVAKSEPFVELSSAVARQVAETDPADLDALLSSKVDGNSTVTDLVNNATAKIGEKLSVRRFVRFAVKSGKQEFYLHMGGKIGVLLEMATDKDLNSNEEFATMCHDIAMHIAASSPKYVYPEEVPAQETEHEKEILTTQALNEGKPAAVVEKVIAGRIKKFFKEICLVEQEFVKNPDVTVGQLVADFGKKAGCSVKIVRFACFVMGEGLEKKVDNLAEEVAKMQNK
ncbi:MAG: elongation factor Ts [Clostridia bacterium]|uniref:translation elongation factor Ts n=1 Tax=Pumilibacter muris TaxID=2941510 RepID=UPI00203D8DF5|nr:translation elongation factor Ts [Pumilibacter muris]MCI8595948.1 elongation factor Ts [Clostridia bacterium]